MERRPTPPEDETIVLGDLSPAELRFVDEFLIDRDPAAAAIRAGVAKINLKKRVAQWMSDPKIVRTIQLKTDTADLDKMISPQRIMAGFIDVAFDRTAPASARNSALRELADLKKMYSMGDEKKNTSGVMLVPAQAALSDWKTAAMEQQNKLKEDVRN